MSGLRVIGGRFGGRRLKAPRGHATHPMSERMRNAIFNMLVEQLPGAHVLDAFAGSGAMGLEAISRGAASSVLVEREKQAQTAITENIKDLGLEKEAGLIRANVAVWLKTVPPSSFDIIFADPPYNDTQFSTVEKLLGLLKPGGLMVLSHPGRGESPAGNKEFVVVDDRSYGKAHLTLYRREY